MLYYVNISDSHAHQTENSLHDKQWKCKSSLSVLHHFGHITKLLVSNNSFFFLLLNGCFNSASRLCAGGKETDVHNSHAFIH